MRNTKTNRNAVKNAKASAIFNLVTWILTGIGFYVVTDGRYTIGPVCIVACIWTLVSVSKLTKRIKK